MPESPKILFWGNQDNNALKLCMLLRAQGYDCKLIAFKHDGPRSHIQNVLLCGDNVPEWIEYFDNTPDWRILRLARRYIDRINREFDILIPSGSRGIISAWQFSLPMICYQLGSELIQHPFPLKFRQLSPRALVSAYFLRKTWKKATKLSSIGFIPDIQAIRRLNLESKVFFANPPEDLRKYRNMVLSPYGAKLAEEYAEYDYVFMWLSRINYKHQHLTDYKGSDRLIDALKMFDDEILEKNFIVLLSSHGYDWEAAKAELSEYKIFEKIRFVEHLPFNVLLTYLNLPNAVIFDSMNPLYNVWGGLSRESLSLGACLVRGYDELVVDRLYGPNCPVTNARSATDVLQFVRTLFALSPNEFQHMRAEVKNWADRYMNVEIQLKPWRRVIDEVAMLSQLQDKYIRN